jgi:rSAM/selenodomain-associated transferase 1
MARFPEVGEVKTRLAGTIGAERACALYRAFLQDIAVRFGERPRPLVWMFHPPECDFASVVAPGARCLPQQGESLGERMHHCFRDLCGEGFERVIMTGADVPHVRDAWLDEAENRLDDADVVLGPSEDGGYDLVAMRHPHDIFSGIAMSTDRVLEQTRQKAAALSLRVHLLPRNFDIDEVGDLVRLRDVLEHHGNDVCLPYTAAVLAQLWAAALW